jgi:hypothetical protein
MKCYAGLIALTLACAPAAVHAQGFISLQLGIQGPPPLVLVQPGIQVVEGINEEIFFSGGFYWCRRDNGWYRARSLGGRFGWVEGRYVPGALRGFPAGRYRNWHHEGWRGDRGYRGPGPRAEERRDVRHEERREDRREDRRDDRHEGEHHH